jgi:hypothetical protein
MHGAKIKVKENKNMLHFARNSECGSHLLRLWVRQQNTSLNTTALSD